jgi:hypothetical protein
MSSAERRSRLDWKKHGPAAALIAAGALITGAASLIKYTPGEIGRQGSAMLVNALEHLPPITSAREAQAALAYTAITTLLTAGGISIVRRLSRS